MLFHKYEYANMQIQIDKYTWVVGERVIPHCFMVSRNVILNVVRWTQVLHGSGGQLHNCTIVCNTHRGEAATTRHDRCNVSGRRGASHYLSSSSFARDLSDFAQTLSHRLVCGQLESDLSACADLPGAADEQLMGSNSS